MFNLFRHLHKLMKCSLNTCQCIVIRTISSKGVISPAVCINSVTTHPTLLPSFPQTGTPKDSSFLPSSSETHLGCFCIWKSKPSFALDKGLLPAQNTVTEEGTETCEAGSRATPLMFRCDFSSGCHTQDNLVRNLETQPLVKSYLDS